jgi:NTE family protein
VALAIDLTVEHVCASAAIPILFQPVCVRSSAGDFYFGDGGLRLVTPFSPAIRLGATHVFAIGVRCQSTAAVLNRRELAEAEEPVTMARPPLSQICGVFLNAIFLDHLDTDLDHLERMNELIAAHGATAAGIPATNGGPAIREPMRRVEPLSINPSQDLALVAEHHARRMPALVRYLMEGLGPADAQSADLMSYLLFDASYTRALVEIGYTDASARVDEVEAFLLGA